MARALTEADRQAIRSLVIEYIGQPGPLRDEMRLFHDLGLYGDDYDDFVRAFAERFDVDLTEMGPELYAPGENGLGTNAFRRRGFMEVSLADLDRFAADGAWTPTGRMTAVPLGFHSLADAPVLTLLHWLRLIRR